jgi:hypothetical protein
MIVRPLCADLVPVSATRRTVIVFTTARVWTPHILFSTHFNIILRFNSRYPKRPLLFRFLDQNVILISMHATRPAQLSVLNLITIIIHRIKYTLTYFYFPRFKVLTAVVMKCTIFWDITPCSPSRVCSHAGFLLGLFFDPEDGGDIFLRNVG